MDSNLGHDYAMFASRHSQCVLTGQHLGVTILLFSEILLKWKGQGLLSIRDSLPLSSFSAISYARNDKPIQGLVSWSISNQLTFLFS